MRMHLIKNHVFQVKSEVYLLPLSILKSSFIKKLSKHCLKYT